MTTLIPKKITLGSEAKHFALDEGVSNGSSVSMTFDVPKGISKHDLVQWMYLEKEKLDLFVLSAEFLKGAVSTAEYTARKATIQMNYDRVLHRQRELPSQPKADVSEKEAGEDLE
ncbi:MAG TPA: hypothetical protein ENI27_00100 [bacterium]|nr:hypothetical protein [bacterium]